VFGVVLDLFFDDIMLRGIRVGGGAKAVDNGLAGDRLVFVWSLSSIEYSSIGVYDRLKTCAIFQAIFTGFYRLNRVIYAVFFVWVSVFKVYAVLYV